MNKNIIIAIAIAIVLLSSIIFGDQIKTFLFGINENLPQATPLLSSSPLPSGTEMPHVLPSASPLVTPAPATYKGRLPEELRPVPEEVKLFSEAQKQEIYRALQNYGKTVNQDPNFFNGWIQLGLLKKTIGDYEGARDAWEYASIIRPQNSLSFGNLGQLYWRYLHQYSQAEINFKASIDHDPNDAGIYTALSDLYFYSFKEKSHLADDILLQGIAVNPKNTDLPKSLARLYEKSGQYAQALEWWQKVLVNDKENASVINTIDALKKKLSAQ